MIQLEKLVGQLHSCRPDHHASVTITPANIALVCKQWHFAPDSHCIIYIYLLCKRLSMDSSYYLEWDPCLLCRIISLSAQIGFWRYSNFHLKLDLHILFFKFRPSLVKMSQEIPQENL